MTVYQELQEGFSRSTNQLFDDAGARGEDFGIARMLFFLGAMHAFAIASRGPDPRGWAEAIASMEGDAVIRRAQYLSKVGA